MKFLILLLLFLAIAFAGYVGVMSLKNGVAFKTQLKNELDNVKSWFGPKAP